MSATIPKETSPTTTTTSRIATISKDQLEADLDAWKSLKINIGVMGDQTELKKLLIDKLVGVEPSTPSVETSSSSSIQTEGLIIEDTTGAVPHTHSNNLNLVVWDLKASNQIELDKCDLTPYDLLILFRNKPGTSSAADRELIESIEKRGKKCLVVTFESSPNEFDFSRLHFDIMQALMILTRDHLTTYGMSIEPASKEIIDAKTSILRSRIEKIAWLSSTFGHILHLPRFNIFCKFLNFILF